MVEWLDKANEEIEYTFIRQRVQVVSSELKQDSSRGKSKMSKTEHDRSGETFVVLADRMMHEHNAYWTRNNVMLVISTGMLAVAFSSNLAVTSMITIFNILGMLVTLIWVIMNILSLRWIWFWEDKLQSFEKTLPEPHVFGEYNKRSKKGRLFPHAVEKLFALVSFLFLMAWVSFIILN